MVKTGDPLILKDARKLKKYGLTKGMKGYCNAVTVLPEEGTFVHFMPEGVLKTFVISEDRVEVDEERLTWLEEAEQSSV